MDIKDKVYSVSKGLQAGADKLMKKSGEFIEISKLNMEINSYERKIDELYGKIGEKIYRKFKKDKEVNKDIFEECRKIEEYEKRINKIKDKIMKIEKKEK